MVEVAHDENRIENGRGSGDIIHAAGVRGGCHHPRRRRVDLLVPALGCGGGAAVGLPYLGEAFDLVAEMLEVVRANA